MTANTSASPKAVVLASMLVSTVSRWMRTNFDLDYAVEVVE